MKRFFSLAFLAAFLFATPTDARNTPHYWRGLGTVLPEVALNAAAGSRTFSLPTNSGIGFSTLMLYINYTHDTDGVLDVTCTGGPSATDKDYVPTTCVVTDGVCTLKFGGVVKTETLTANKKFWARLGIAGAKDVQCVASESTATADDKVEIKAFVIAD